MIDTHCHLASKKYPKPIDEIIKSAKDKGVTKFITIGTSLASNLENQKTAEKFDGVFYTAGIYPHEDMNLSIDAIENIFRKQLQNMPNIIGIGECGIDITDRPNQRSIEDQIKLFEMQIKIAKELKLPLIIHNRNADEQIIKILKKHKGKDLKGVAHTFTSNWETGKKLIKLGFYISFSGIITFNNVDDILDTVKKVPNDKFLIETDAPWLAPAPYRGKINKPEYVTITAQKIAETKKLPLKEIEVYSYENAHNLFNLK